MMSNEEMMNREIDQSQFEFVNSTDNLHDAKFETKPIGYFKDAMRRFRKNKGSVIGGIIILFLILFAVCVPIFSSRVATSVRDAYYSKKPSRLMWAYGLFNGSREKEYNENTLLSYYGVGVGAEYYYDADTNTEHFATFEEGKKSHYQPVVKRNSGQTVGAGVNSSRIFKANIDEYLGVGFTEKEFSKAEYNKIVAWEEKSGLRILYPLIDKSSPYYFNPGSDAAENYWYKASTDRYSKGAPLDESGNIINLETDNFAFVDIYLRDTSGKPVFFQLSGGGDFETANRKCRILYYNYYRYMYNCEPNYAFGTDSQGYDLAYRMATGMRLSFILAVAVSVINFVIGAIYGAIEGYYGGAADLIMERITDILVDVPFVVVATLFQLHLAKKVGPIWSLLFAFILTGWIGTASRVRSQFYRFKNSEYVLAARTLGARDARIMWRHVFPNTLGTLITSSVLVIPGVIFSESMLSYLGIMSLGTSTSTSLGTLLSEASSVWTQYPHLMIFPAIVISLLMICFNLFGNGLRDAFNPTLRGADE